MIDELYESESEAMGDLSQIVIDKGGLPLTQLSFPNSGELNVPADVDFVAIGFEFTSSVPVISCAQYLQYRTSLTLMIIYHEVRGTGMGGTVTFFNNLASTFNASWSLHSLEYTGERSLAQNVSVPNEEVLKTHTASYMSFKFDLDFISLRDNNP
jgi:hypothetical protein